MNDDRFVELYARHGPFIYARCHRILRDRYAAEDAAQETFLRVYRHLATAPTAEAAARWIARIATNYCLNMVRDKRHDPELFWDESSVPDTSTGEDRQAERDLAQRLVLRAPYRIRAASWLHYVDGLDQSEVAKVLQVSRRTVVNRLAGFERFARQFLSRSAAQMPCRPQATDYDDEPANRGSI